MPRIVATPTFATAFRQFRGASVSTFSMVFRTGIADAIVPKTGTRTKRVAPLRPNAQYKMSIWKNTTTIPDSVDVARKLEYAAFGRVIERRITPISRFTRRKEKA